MRYNLLRHNLLRQVKEVHEDLSFNIFDKRFNYLIISLMSFSILGQCILNPAFSFVLSIARWPLCRICFMSFISLLGIAILLLLRIRLLTVVSSSLRL